MPPTDPGKPLRNLPTERMLAVTRLSENHQDVFTSAEPLWHPIWAKGLYGGALIAQALTAAQQTVPCEFLVHSMHCHFLFAARNSTSIHYHIERVRDGGTIFIRTVQAHQSGKCIFSTTISFFRYDPQRDKRALKHHGPVPLGLEESPPSRADEDVEGAALTNTCQAENGSLIECVRLPQTNAGMPPSSKRIKQWVRIRDRTRMDDNAPTTLGKEATLQAHLAALAYISDNYFIGTVARFHGAARFTIPGFIENAVQSLKSRGSVTSRSIRCLQDLVDEEVEERLDGGLSGGMSANVEMMVSLDHTIYFHNQVEVVADEWMLAEFGTPWAGDERGLVVQRIWTSDGIILATCFQEGLVRVQCDPRDSKI